MREPIKNERKIKMEFLNDGTLTVLLITALSNISDRLIKLMKAYIPILYLPPEIEEYSDKIVRKRGVEWLALIVPLIVSIGAVAFLDLYAGIITDEMAILTVVGVIPASTAWFTLESYRKSKKALAQASLFNNVALSETQEETEK